MKGDRTLKRPLSQYLEKIGPPYHSLAQRDPAGSPLASILFPNEIFDRNHFQSFGKAPEPQVPSIVTPLNGCLTWIEIEPDPPRIQTLENLPGVPQRSAHEWPGMIMEASLNAEVTPQIHQLLELFLS